MFGVLSKLDTYRRLGLDNIARISVYSLLCRTGFYRRRQPIGSSYPGPFWNWASECKPASVPTGSDWYKKSERILSGELQFFSSAWRNVGFPPAWVSGGNMTHWTEVDEFSLHAGDIKNLWEPSRFDGLLVLALAWMGSGDSRLSEAMESWMGSWVDANPANAGIQWKCGQETGIRLMNILLVTELLNIHSGVSHSPSLERFVLEHCRRIAPTMLYAIAQDNNHGTSEAAALYMAGLWLKNRNARNPDAELWYELGRKWLENRVSRLVMDDGTFSQYSVNYHRLMLDTVVMAEWWRQHFNDTRFSSEWYKHCGLATGWLSAMIDPVSGDAPNIGANDGARIFVLHGLPYRDFRPTVQLASVLFNGRRRYGNGGWDEPLYWLKYDIPASMDMSAGKAAAFRQGGYVRLSVNNKVWGILRLPVFRFRPGHADALHFDFWSDGTNWLRDGGTYSYNTEEKWLNYFPGTSAHSTVQFDGRNQMPRLGRFLFGNWLHCKEFIFDPTRPNFVKAGYVDSFAASHYRSVTLDNDTCLVEDELAGFKEKAVLRWRLPRMKWLLNGIGVSSGRCAIEVTADVPLIRAEVVDGYESLYYGEIETIPVFEVEVASSPAKFKTLISFSNL